MKITKDNPCFCELSQYLGDRLLLTRNDLHLSQMEFANELCIEHSKNLCCAVTLLAYLYYHCEDVPSLLDDCRNCRTTIHLVHRPSKKEVRLESQSVIVELRQQEYGRSSSLMNSITQDMKYRYSLMKYAEKYGVSHASGKYNKAQSYIYFWQKRFDSSIESLVCQSRRPHSHPASIPTRN